MALVSRTDWLCLLSHDEGRSATADTVGVFEWTWSLPISFGRVLSVQGLKVSSKVFSQALCVTVPRDSGVRLMWRAHMCGAGAF